MILDNLACLKTVESVGAAGAELRFLPPYSPDLNRIVHAFSMLKALPRKAGERTVDGLCRLLDRLVDEFSPGECGGYLSNFGY